MGASPFQTDHAPIVGQTEWLAEDIRAVTAGNAGPMTFTGTRSYLLGTGQVALIDPGPDDSVHFATILAALEPGERVSAIFVTHSHMDHSPLAHRFDAPVHGFGGHDAARAPIMETLGDLGGGEGIDAGFNPDRLLTDGQIVSGDTWQIEAIHTPGHLSNHLCYSSGNRLFSGDHVMGWASTLISPPDGDLGSFMASLATLQQRSEKVYYPGHGAPITDPQDIVGHLITHRKAREAQILQNLEGRAKTARELVACMYGDVDRRLWGAAERNVLAHLIDLFQRNLVVPEGAFTPDAIFRLT